MIEKSHRLRETDAGAVSPCYRGAARAMEPDVRELRFSSEEPRPIAAALQELYGLQIPCDRIAAGDQMLDQRYQTRAQRRLINGAAFAVDRDGGGGFGVQVDIAFQVNPRLAEPAPLGDCDFKTDPHPFRGRGKMFPDGFFFVDRDLVDLPLRFAAESQPEARISGGELSPNSFVHDDPQHFDVRGDRPGCDRLFVFCLATPPGASPQINELHDGAVIEPGRESDLELVEDRLDRSPGGQVPVLSGFGVAVMRFEPGSDPNLPFVFVARATVLFLFNGLFRAEFARGPGLFAIVPTEAGGLPPARACIRIPKPDLPVLGIFLLFKRRHTDTSNHTFTIERNNSICLPKENKSAVFFFTYGAVSWVRIPPPPPLVNREYGHKHGQSFIGRAG